MDKQAMVKEFHETFNLVKSDKPGNITGDVVNRRLKLIREELGEYEDAAMVDDIIEIADALADLLYVVYGTAIEHGIDIDPIFAEVHRSNMSKVGGHKNEYGKFIKPDTWTPPDLKPILKAQGAELE